MSGIKLSELLAADDLDVPAGGDTESILIGEARRLEAIEKNTNGHIVTLTEDDAGPCLETATGWSGGIVWVGYIPSERAFLVERCQLGTMTSLIDSAERSSDRIRMNAIVEGYNATHGNKAVLWPLPVNAKA